MYKTKTKLYKWNGVKGAWFFVNINKTLSKKIKSEKQIPKAKGFGSIRVRVTIGQTTWPTSVFPTKEGMYVLPIKASVRKKEGINDGDMVSVMFEPVFLH